MIKKDSLVRLIALGTNPEIREYIYQRTQELVYQQPEPEKYRAMLDQLRIFARQGSVTEGNAWTGSINERTKAQIESEARAIIAVESLPKSGAEFRCAMNDQSKLRWGDHTTAQTGEVSPEIQRLFNGWLEERHLNMEGNQILQKSAADKSGKANLRPVDPQEFRELYNSKNEGFAKYVEKMSGNASAIKIHQLPAIEPTVEVARPE